MAAIDSFARLLFEEAKRFYEKGNETAGEGQLAYFHASIFLAFSSLEANINAIAEEHLLISDLTLQDKSILQEREIIINKGEFELKNLKIFRIQDRIEFLCQRFSKTGIDKKQAYWSDFLVALDLRNNLTHPKDAIEIDKPTVERFLRSILEILNILYTNIYDKPYPGYRRGLDSSLNF